MRNRVITIVLIIMLMMMVLVGVIIGKNAEEQISQENNIIETNEDNISNVDEIELIKGIENEDFLAEERKIQKIALKIPENFTGTLKEFANEYARLNNAKVEKIQDKYVVKIEQEQPLCNIPNIVTIGGEKYDLKEGIDLAKLYYDHFSDTFFSSYLGYDNEFVFEDKRRFNTCINKEEDIHESHEKDSIECYEGDIVRTVGYMWAPIDKLDDSEILVDFEYGGLKYGMGIEEYFEKVMYAPETITMQIEENSRKEPECWIRATYKGMITVAWVSYDMQNFNMAEFWVRYENLQEKEKQTNINA